MAVEIGALRALLSLDSASFEKGAKRAQGATKNLQATMKSVAKVAAAAFAAVTAAALAGAQDIDKVAKASRRIGSSIAGFEALKLAAGEAGVSLSSLPDELQNINREIANIGTSGNADRALERIGLSAKDLAGIDADEKLARIADRVRELGLSSGEATAVLRDLGVRNREMVLLFQQGGGAIRAARSDVIDYGLALSGPVVASIEQANDRIGRLSLVSRVFGQQMALAVVPALGSLALAITDSLRDGGALRSAIDGIVAATRGWVSVISVVATGISNLADVIGGPVIVAVAALSAAFVILRRRMILTGIGALIVGAGVLIDFIVRLRSSTGSWGESLAAVGKVGKAVFLGVGNTAWGLLNILAGVAAAITGEFVRAFSEIAKSWDLLVNGMASAWNAIADTSFGRGLGFGRLGRSDISGTISGVADRLFDDAEASIKRGGERIKSAGAGVADAVSALRDTLKGGGGTTSDAADEARRLADELDGSGGGSGGGAEKAANAARRAAQSLADASRTDLEVYRAKVAEINELHRRFPEIVTTEVRDRALGQLRDDFVRTAESANIMGFTMRRAFVGLTTGATGLSGVLRQVVSRLQEIAANRAFDVLIGKKSGGGGLLGNLGGIFKGVSGLFGPGQTTGTGLTTSSGNLLPPSFDGGGFTGFGSRSGGIDGRGGFLATMHPNEVVTDLTKSRGGTNVVVPVQVNIQKGAERDGVTRRSGPNGQEIIDVAVSDSFGAGRQDGVVGPRFGIRPQAARR